MEKQQGVELTPTGASKLSHTASLLLDIAQTGEQKKVALKVATVALSEINFTRLKKMLLLLSAVEDHMIDRLLNNEASQDEVMQLYLLISASARDANKQIQATIKSLDSSTLLDIIGGVAIETEPESLANISEDAVLALRDISSI